MQFWISARVMVNMHEFWRNILKVVLILALILLKKVSSGVSKHTQSSIGLISS